MQLEAFIRNPNFNHRKACRKLPHHRTCCLMEKYPAVTVDSPNLVNALALSKIVWLISSAVACALDRDKWDEARKWLEVARDLKKVPNISKETEEQIDEIVKVNIESIGKLEELETTVKTAMER